MLRDLPVKFQVLSSKNITSHHLCVLKLNLKVIKKKYEKIFNEFRQRKLGINLHYLPIYSHPYYKKLKKYKQLKNTEHYYKSAI